MKKLQFHILLFGCMLLSGILLFCVPVSAQEEEGEYYLTLNSGESCSTKDIWYGVYTVSETNIPSYSGWCKGCSGGSHLTYMDAASVKTSYQICVDGAPIQSITSNYASTGTIDFSAFSNSDSTISLPVNYIVSQTIRCDGGRYDGGTSISSCGYSQKRTITVSGSLRLYRKSKRPQILSNPVPVSGCTDGSASFSVTGEAAVRYYWQRISNGNVETISDGKSSTGTFFSGCSSPTLNLSGIRLVENGNMFRCILVGENGEEVSSEPAAISVKDVTAPVIKLSYSPSEKTTQPVTILIKATDADSGLPDSPFYYLDAYHREDSFTVSKCGTYDVVVVDNAGNKATSSVNINNIYVKPAPTTNPTPVSPAPTGSVPTQNPTPTSPATTQPTLAVPTQVPENRTPTSVAPTKTTPIATPTAVPTTTVSDDNQKDKSDSGTDGDAEEKKVVIQNLQDVEMPETLAAADEIETELLETEPEEPVEPLQERKDYTVMILCLGFLLLVLFILAILAMIFMVSVETMDEMGKWHYHTFKFLKYKKEWCLCLEELLEDYDTLNLKFGGLFMVLCADRSLRIICGENEELVLDAIKKSITLSYEDVRGGR